MHVMFKILFILEHEFLKHNKYKNFDRFGIVRLASRRVLSTRSVDTDR